MTTNQLDLTT
jgi:hypothetical protein